MSSFSELFRKVLWQLMHASMRGFWHYTKEHGLSMTQMFILRQLLGEQGGCNVSMMGEQMGVTSAAVSQALDRLVQQGLVSRTEDPQDRRHKRIQLTPRGKQVLNEGLEARQAWIADLDARLTEDEKALIVRALALLADRLPPFY
ncbi:MAG: MarR family transcriptional regulator [Anaerolineae bacterium]